jgi:peptidyl-tRNA hydrolase ICT1
MLQSFVFRPLYSKVLRLPSKLVFVHYSRAYSRSGTSEDDFDAARRWYLSFNKNSIPESISKTSYSRASGPGGQKTNKYVTDGACFRSALITTRTNSKATTTWHLSLLEQHVPKVIYQELPNCRYYVSSSNSISIQCDLHRSQGENKSETYQRLNDEIKKMYIDIVPGVTSPEQKAKIEQL